MAKKELKINIKNAQIAEAINLGKIKEKLASKKLDGKDEQTVAKTAASEKKEPPLKDKKTAKDIATEEEEAPRRKARSRSAFAEPTDEQTSDVTEQLEQAPETKPEVLVEEVVEPLVVKKEVKEEIKKVVPKFAPKKPAPFVQKRPEAKPRHTRRQEPKPELRPLPPPRVKKPAHVVPQRINEQLGPTGKHINDLLKPKPIPKKPEAKPTGREPARGRDNKQQDNRSGPAQNQQAGQPAKKPAHGSKFKQYRDVKPAHRQPQKPGRFDARDRHGLRSSDDDSRWRKRRSNKGHHRPEEDTTIRPSELSVRLPISIKDLAQEMKLKASQLISKLFLQGVVVTINDVLDDETTVQLLGEEFGCALTIDTSEEERIRITGKSIKEEISEADPESLTMRAPVVAFMGHVDHGKTSLIDYIRKSNIIHGEAGSITQHVGAFLCTTDVGQIAILDTPGHEAFSAMRARGAEVTDIVVLVVAGDEGMRAQTEEAINHAKAAGVTIVVAINKSDKPNFDQEKVYRQLADIELLPEPWGGTTITVNCSAVTGEGVKELLDMLALQAEILELKANPSSRARGTVIESELHKGMGAVATVLVQNGTLRLGDSLVFGDNYGRVKTMRDEFGKQLDTAGPSTPIEITGLSGIPEAGDEFITVDSEKEARTIAEARKLGKRQLYLQQNKAKSLENIFQQASDEPKKTLKVILRADVQGSMEALKTGLMKIESDKANVDIISAGVGEVSESDVLLAAASNAIIIGFHTQVESHAESLLKQHGIHVILHDIIYHAIDDVKDLMAGMLDKVAEEVEKGKAEIRTVFKASLLGKIAGCQVIEGTIQRKHNIRIMRKGEEIWKGMISSLKRVTEDVREVQKGVECGIVLKGFSEIEEGDIIEAYEITYISQAL